MFLNKCLTIHFHEVLCLFIHSSVLTGSCHAQNSSPPHSRTVSAGRFSVFFPSLNPNHRYKLYIWCNLHLLQYANWAYHVIAQPICLFVCLQTVTQEVLLIVCAYSNWLYTVETWSWLCSQEDMRVDYDNMWPVSTSGECWSHAKQLPILG